MVSRVDVLGGFSVAFIALFANSYLQDTHQQRISKGILRVTLFFVFIIIVNSFWGTAQVGNYLSISLAFFIGIIILVVTLRALKENYERLKYFAAGYGVLVAGLIIFSLRLAGLIPNNELTLLALLLTHVIEIILFSAGVAEIYNNYRKMSEKNELAFLRAQIKPHFLYNTLNVIAAIAIKDSEKTRKLLLDFAEFLKYSFDLKNNENLISFDEELKAVHAYVRIQQARFPGMIEVEYDLAHAQDLKLPQFIIQPLVENAIQHGLRKVQKPGKVKISTRIVSEGLEISVEDNGVGLTGEQIEEIKNGTVNAKSGVGLMNIQKRLKSLYNTSLNVQSNLNEGSRFSFILPCGGRK